MAKRIHSNFHCECLLFLLNRLSQTVLHSWYHAFSDCSTHTGAVCLWSDVPLKSCLGVRDYLPLPYAYLYLCVDICVHTYTPTHKHIKQFIRQSPFINSILFEFRLLFLSITVLFNSTSFVKPIWLCRLNLYSRPFNLFILFHEAEPCKIK